MLSSRKVARLCEPNTILPPSHLATAAYGELRCSTQMAAEVLIYQVSARGWGMLLQKTSETVRQEAARVLLYYLRVRLKHFQTSCGCASSPKPCSDRGQLELSFGLQRLRSPGTQGGINHSNALSTSLWLPPTIT